METEGQEPELGLNQVKADAIALPAPIVHKGVRVITTELLAKCYGTQDAALRKNHQRNQARFTEGEHYFILKGAELKALKTECLGDTQFEIGKNAKELTLWTERGAARHAKILETDQAWSMFGKLEDAYFAGRPAQPDPMAMLNDPAAMRGLLLTYAEKVIELESKMAEQAPALEAFDRIATADGSLNITEAAKALQMRPGDLFDWLSRHGWIYKRAGSASWLGYASHTNNGDLEHKVTTVLRPDGSEKVTEQVRITAQGLAKIAKLNPPKVRAA